MPSGGLERIRDVLVRGLDHLAGRAGGGAAGGAGGRPGGLRAGGAERAAAAQCLVAGGGGELLGIVGPSGAGKSTLARLIVGLWAPTSGGIFLDGQSTFAHERGSFGEAVGYLPQDPLLLDGKVRENIASVPRRRHGRRGRGARLAGVHELIGRLPQGYETRLADAGARLSGGQRQRRRSRGRTGEPKLIVMDEPNSNLDGEGEAALIDAMEIARARGRGRRGGGAAHVDPEPRYAASRAPRRGGGAVRRPGGGAGCALVPARKGGRRRGAAAPGGRAGERRRGGAADQLPQHLPRSGGQRSRGFSARPEAGRCMRGSTARW